MGEMVCAICGSRFTSRDSRANVCSQICKKIRQKNTLRAWRSKNKDMKLSKCEWCGCDFVVTRTRKITCSDNCEDSNAREKKSLSDRYYKRRNRDKISGYHRGRYHNDLRYFVAIQMKKQLGFTPPPDLVEEATALRLLNRAIRKAGE